jgi:hypothetical protein
MNTIRTWVLFLVSILIAANPVYSLVQAQNSVGGSANGASANVTATVAGINADVTVPPVAPVTLPAQGGSDTNQVASVFAQLSTPGVVTVLSTGFVANATSGFVTQSSAHSESSSTVNNLSILNGLVTASTIRSKSTSDGNGASATSTAAGSFANQLRIAGVLYEQSEFAPNTTVSANATIQATVAGLPVLVPMTGTVTINEQTGSGNATTTSSLAVNFLHVSVSGSVAGSISLSADIIVASASSSVNFTAAPPPANHPPALNVPGPQTVQAGNTLTFGVSATDSDAEDSVTIAASNLPQHASFTQTSGNPANGQLSFATTASDVGTTTVSFTATDNHGASTAASVQITVTSSPPPPTNHPPTLNLPGPQVAQVGVKLTFDVSASDQDAGDTVTLDASNIPPGASVMPKPSTGNPAGAQVTFTPNSSQAGQAFTINFIATDNHGASVSGSVKITVGNSPPPPPVNHPPIISVPGPQTIEVGKTLTFTVTASDPDGDPVILGSDSLPTGASFNPATGIFSFTPSGSQAGMVLTASFTATDPAGASASASVPITVTVRGGNGSPGPPIISVPPSPIIIPVGTTLVFPVVAISQRPNCSVSISASDLPAHASFDPLSNRFAFTPTEDQKDRSFVVIFTATDCSGQNATATVTIIVISATPSGVQAPGHICVPVTKVFFDTAPANGSCGFITVSLTNAGMGVLRITSMGFLDGTHFRLEAPASVPITLQSAGVIQLKIMFQPKSAGTFNDTLTITTDDPANPVITIVLKGKGSR